MAEVKAWFGKIQEIESISKNKLQFIHDTVRINSSKFSESENAGCETDSSSLETLYIIRFSILHIGYNL